VRECHLVAIVPTSVPAGEGGPPLGVRLFLLALGLSAAATLNARTGRTHAISSTTRCPHRRAPGLSGRHSTDRPANDGRGDRMTQTDTPTTHDRPARRAVRAVTLVVMLVAMLLAVGLALVASSTTGSLRLPVGIALLAVTALTATLQRITSAG
jgi:hypothetical protein